MKKLNALAWILVLLVLPFGGLITLGLIMEDHNVQAYRKAHGCDFLTSHCAIMNHFYEAMNSPTYAQLQGKGERKQFIVDYANSQDEDDIFFLTPHNAKICGLQSTTVSPSLRPITDNEEELNCISLDKKGKGPIYFIYFLPIEGEGEMIMALPVKGTYYTEAE